MTDHVRLQALKKLCELIEQDTGMRAFRGRQVLGTSIKTPFVNITEAIRTGSTETAGGGLMRNDRVDFLLSGYADVASVDNPIDIAYRHVARLEKAFSKIIQLDQWGNPLYKEWYNLGGLISRFHYQAPVCHNPPDEPTGKAFFYIFFSLNVAYDSREPTESVVRKC